MFHASPVEQYEHSSRQAAEPNSPAARFWAEYDRLRRVESAAVAHLAATEGHAVGFRDGLTRADLAAAVDGRP